MRIAAWNINSVRARVDRLTDWLSRAQPDVLCLQELKCQAEVFPFDAIERVGYQAAVYGQPSYNGVAILSRTEISDVERGIPDGAEDTHARVIAGTVDGVRIFSVYAPNGQAVGSPAYAYKLEWYARLRRYLDARHDPAEALVLCGDFNVAPEDRDVHDPAAWVGSALVSDAERDALRTLAQFGLSDTFRLHHPEPGRFSWWDYRMLAFPKNMGLRIDHVLASQSLASACVESEIDRDARKGKQPSDHAPVWAEFTRDGRGERIRTSDLVVPRLTLGDQ